MEEYSRKYRKKDLLIIHFPGIYAHLYSDRIYSTLRKSRLEADSAQGNHISDYDGNRTQGNKKQDFLIHLQLLHFLQQEQSPQQDELLFLRWTASTIAPAITAAITTARIISTGFSAMPEMVTEDLLCMQAR